MIAGVAVDPWKVEIFKRHFDAAGFTYELIDDDKTPLIKWFRVTCEGVAQIAPIIKAAQDECFRKRMN